MRDQIDTSSAAPQFGVARRFIGAGIFFSPPSLWHFGAHSAPVTMRIKDGPERSYFKRQLCLGPIAFRLTYLEEQVVVWDLRLVVRAAFDSVAKLDAKEGER